MNYALHPGAEADLREAAQYYRDRAGATLAQAFIAEFEHSALLLTLHPLLGSTTLRGRRRLVMRRFPYTIIYVIAEQEIQILAVAHQSRRPGFWRTRK